MRTDPLRRALIITDRPDARSWYGPPPSAASTSKLPSQLPIHTVSASASTLANGHTVFREPSVTPSDSPAPGTKKRKRLTGSQKKARKAAKLAAATTAAAGDEEECPAGAEDHDDEHATPQTAVPPRRGPPSPTYTPSSPKISRTGHPPSPSPPPAASTSASATLTRPIGPQHPSSFSFVVPPVSSLPTTFPPPPPIAPLTGDEPALEAETPEALLEAALWSWYSGFFRSRSPVLSHCTRAVFERGEITHRHHCFAAAGYQTALYHAAVGVAKFKPSADESS